MSTSYLVKVEGLDTPFITEDMGEAMAQFFHEIYAEGAEHVELVYSA